MRRKMEYVLLFAVATAACISCKNVNNKAPKEELPVESAIVSQMPVETDEGNISNEDGDKEQVKEPELVVDEKLY